MSRNTGRAICVRRYKDTDRRTLRGRIALFHDHLELSWWGLSGKRRIGIALTNLEEITWWPGDNPNFGIFGTDGSSMFLVVKGPGLLKHAIDSHLSETGRPPLPETRRETPPVRTPKAHSQVAA